MEITSINFVSTLKWNTINDECLICNNQIGSNCIKCSTGQYTTVFTTTPSVLCMSVLNANTDCKHSFHAHCLTQYHRTSANMQKCPICNNQWKSK